MKKILLGLLIINVFSCSVIKRKHLRGYHVEWNNKEPFKVNNKSTQAKIQIDNSRLSDSEQSDDKSFSTSVENAGQTNSDLIASNNTSVFEGVSRRRNRIVIPKEPHVNASRNVRVSTFKEEKIRKPQSSIASPKGESKSLTIAIILWFFVGIIGIHRLYLGYFGLGILYLLTGGLCGIGWLIDGILFFTGNLKPNNGDYI